MTSIRSTQPAVSLGASIVRSAPVWVCFLLLGLLAIAQVAHVHKNANDGDHCTLCMVLHTIAPAAVAAIAIVLVYTQQIIPVPVLVVARRRRTQVYFIRPPPTDF